MKFLKEYKVIILFIISLISTSAVAQYRLWHVETELEKTKIYINKQDTKIILAVKEESEKIKLQAEKDYIENKKEIEKLKLEQKSQTILKVNQRYIREDISDLKSLVKDLANEIRRGK